MPETSSSPNEAMHATGKMRREIRYDAVAAIIAALVGLLALIVAGYTAYLQRQQVRAQVWPYLQLGQSNADGQYELTAINRGVGPVVVQSVQVLADGKPVPDWDGLFRLFDFDPTDKHVSSTLGGSVLAPGDHLHWIAFRNAEDINAFTAVWTRFHVEARVCYASTLGETWLTVYRPGWPGGFRPQPVPACPLVPESARFSD